MMLSIKDRLIMALGFAGVIIYYILITFIAVIPFVMINVPLWLSCIFVVVCWFFPLLDPVFWVWGLVCTISGPQDWIAIVYYILFVFIALPFFAYTIASIIFNRR